MSRQDNLLKRYERKISCLKEDGEVSVIPVTERLSNIYENGDSPKCIKFTFDTHGEDVEYILKLTLEKPFGDRVYLNSVAAKDGDVVTVNLPDLSETYGIFTLYVSSERDGETVCVQPIPFSHIKTAQSSFAKSGVVTHLLYHDKPDTYDCVRLLKKAGLYIIRDDILWRCNETEKGKPQVAQNYLNTINYFCREGIQPHLILDYGNDFYDNGSAPQTEEGLAAYVRYCETVVKTFKGKVMHYEVWNEYNLGFGGADGSPEKYSWQLKATYKAIKAIDPDITVTAAVTCGTQPEWIRRMLEAGAYEYFDEISIHPYCGMLDSTYPDENQGQAEANVQSYIDVISEYGDPKPVWISEMGWTTSAFEGSANRDEQAAAIVRLFVIAETSDIIKRLTFYDFRDDGTDIYDMEHHWGLIETEYGLVPNAAKESYAALCFLNCMLNGAEFSHQSVSDAIKLKSFSKDNRTLNILWSLDGSKKVTLKLSDKADVYDIYGNRINISYDSGFAIIQVDERPIYIYGPAISVEKCDIPERLIYDYPYTLSAVPVFRNDGWYLKAVVNNHSNILNGRLRIQLPELNISGNYESFLLNKDQSFSTEIKVGNTDIKNLYRAVIDLNLANGVRDIKTELVSFIRIPFGKTDKITFALDSRENYFRIDGCGCPELKAEVALSYDEEKLYLNADVFEKCHLQKGTTTDMWMDIWDGDGLEFIIQPLYDGNSENTRYNHIGLALTSNTNDAVAWRWRTVSNRSIGRFRDCCFKSERKDGVTVYRAEFQWKDLLPPNVLLKDCDSFGFAFRVNYAESKSNGIDGYLQLYSGIGSWRKPFDYQPIEFGRFILQRD